LELTSSATNDQSGVPVAGEFADHVVLVVVTTVTMVPVDDKHTRVLLFAKAAAPKGPISHHARPVTVVAVAAVV